MLPRLAFQLARPAQGSGSMAAKPLSSLLQVRYASKKAFAGGSKGRDMPLQKYRTPSSPSAVKGSTATLTIRDGPVFHGKPFGAKNNISGEAVFTTSLVGYPESMTDPSYRGQILVFTQPLIGNYGVPSNERDEYNLLKYFDHWTAVESLSEEGLFLAKITVGEEYDADEDESFVDPGAINLVKKVSTKAPFVVESPGADLHVALIDCGVKENILRSLVSRGASVTVFPYNYPIHKVASNFDGVFISNGPGDPTHCQETTYNLARLIDTSEVPVMGICLGHQLLARRWRPHHQAQVRQNHGYAVDSKTLPDEYQEYFVNLNDGSNEGMIHKTRPIFSTQFHPEAKGGPMDSSYLFDKYIESVKAFKASQSVYKDNRPTRLMLDILSRERVGVEPTPLPRPSKTDPVIVMAGGRGIHLL
ncbi:unnamed protein product [Parascedosporium putredinis]|uniref:carbamoyl-phosphate synthase (glutamine-hydrolyzing) n=1 Tax=Parascedosporium putredinis TaxID=1442378 RepID=A0A9P1M562_9PEZI|nr:unnamed protein product [Parascedosporium putredinis]CAI7987759.1 unnamed protein product [Parascedosporium putredinis]